MDLHFLRKCTNNLINLDSKKLLFSFNLIMRKVKALDESALATS